MILINMINIMILIQILAFIIWWKSIIQMKLFRNHLLLLEHGLLLLLIYLRNALEVLLQFSFQTFDLLQIPQRDMFR